MENLPEDKIFRSFTLASIYIDQGKNREAQMILKELMEDDPSNETIRDAMQQVSERLEIKYNTRMHRLIGQWIRLLMIKNYKDCLDKIQKIKL
jgi:hypothetical protein